MLRNCNSNCIIIGSKIQNIFEKHCGKKVLCGNKVTYNDYRQPLKFDFCYAPRLGVQCLLAVAGSQRGMLKSGFVDCQIIRGVL